MTEYPFTSALVTGASSGIGESMTRRLSAAGVPVVAVARRTDRLDALAGELGANRANGAIEVLTADLGGRLGQDAVAERIGDPDRPIDLLVNSAGFGTNGAFAELDVDRLSSEIELNVTALTRLSHAAVATMVSRGRGWVLNVSSVAGFQPAPHLAVYAATKAFVTSFSESLHQEVRNAGVRVTALCPGLTGTEFQAVSNTEHYQSSLPGFLWTSAEQVAAAGLADAAKGKALSVPGLVYKAMASVSSVTPRSVLRLAASLVPRH